ncbi:MAG: DegT/DnrJ/EryC1/StrS family aminotransferase [Muribaculum sp.]|nr:DegT/DnrJ/EryC1/StrS family aminotransferase [Muribaculum sp.]
MNKNIPFLSLSRTNAPLSRELREAALRVIDSGWYLHGPQTRQLESHLAELTGRNHAIGVSNGLDAIRLIFRALIELGRLSAGDGVLVPANTYIASILPITEFGLVPVLLEPDPDTFGINWEQALTLFETSQSKQSADKAGEATKIKALLTVHLYGNPSWDTDIAARLQRQGVIIIEDNAQAIGASISGIPTGGLGDAAAFSFYPTKNVGALGDAGAVTTDDTALEKTIRALANYGSDRRYHNIYRGYNCRIDEMQAAFLNVKLTHLNEITRSRQEAANAYLDKIANPAVALPAILPRAVQVWHQFPIRTPYRDALRTYLSENGIATDIHYAVPPHRQPCYENTFSGRYPLTEQMADTLISLPISDITPAQAEYIAGVINSFRPTLKK